MTAHVTKDQVVLTFEMAENLPPERWEMLLDELKSEHIPGLYQNGKRSHASFERGTGKTRVVIYLTSWTVAADMARATLQKWNIDLVDERGNPAR